MNYNLILKKTTSVIALVISIILFIFYSCEQEPNDLGLNFLPGDDTLGTKVLNSETDTIEITNSSFLQYINTYSSYFSLVGKFQNYESKLLLKFKDITSNYDSCSVLSATLNLTYNNYYFQDSLGITSFDIHPLTDTVTFNTITFDKFNNSYIGSDLLGTYTGTLTDTITINIPFDTSTVRKWLWKAANSNYPYVNYGMILNPNSSSTTIKGFYSNLILTDSIKPYIKAIVQKGTKIDTIVLNSSESVTLSNVTNIIIPQDRFILNTGISYRSILKFDLTKLPQKVTINDAYLEFKLDGPNSFIKNKSDSRIAFSRITDTTGSVQTDGILFFTSKKDSVTYTIRLQYIFQKWNMGAPNLGVLLNYVYDYQGIDKYTFYSQSIFDNTKRPLLILRYTPR
ncbi:MAG: hypothetical protein N2490_05800 [Ignavibacteria bacterium]|nr:hypothetical protein [Ignavibacteria bacterium]